MNKRYLKTALIVLVSVFVIQGCALYVTDDGYPHYRHRYPRHYQYRGEWHSSLEQQSPQSLAQELDTGGMWSRRG